MGLRRFDHCMVFHSLSKRSNVPGCAPASSPATQRSSSASSPTAPTTAAPCRCPPGGTRARRLGRRGPCGGQSRPLPGEVRRRAGDPWTGAALRAPMPASTSGRRPRARTPTSPAACCGRTSPADAPARQFPVPRSTGLGACDPGRRASAPGPPPAGLSADRGRTSAQGNIDSRRSSRHDGAERLDMPPPNRSSSTEIYPMQ